jgi:hypothetical protein
MSLLSLKAKFTPKPVSVDGQTFYVSVLSALEKDRFDLQYASFRGDGGGVGLRGFLTAFCLCDETGKKEFSSGDKKEASSNFLDAVKTIGDLPSNVVEPIFEAACDINGFNEGSGKN